MVFLSVFKFSSHVSISNVLLLNFLNLCWNCHKIPKRAGSFIDSLRITVKGGPGGMGHPKYGILVIV